MYLFRFLNTPLGGGAAATQTFAPGGKYPRAATELRAGRGCAKQSASDTGASF